MPKEKSGFPPSKGVEGTAETSFIEGGLDYVKAKIRLENEKLMNNYPEYEKRSKSGKLLILEYKLDKKGKGRVYVRGPAGGGPYPLYLADEETLNPKLPKSIMETLGPKTTELIDMTDGELDRIEKELQEDTRIADDENEQPSVRERAGEKITENTERRDQLVQEREQLVEKLPFREKIKELFKKNGFTIATVVTAVGLTIGVLYKILKDGASSATNAIKNVSSKVGDGLKELGKKIGSILPGLVGAIASFVFRRPVRLSHFSAKTLGFLSFSWRRS